MNDAITFTQLSSPEIRKLVREELECFFADKVHQKIDKDELGGIGLAMEVTGLAKATIYSHVSRRSIPHKKRGKFLYFSKSELIDWINGGRRKTHEEINLVAQEYSTARGR
ncbi:MAG: helix-turn-helix domain-containing protein [Pyrinomonadaceae bacterium]|nr:helix-turn-helix domain-containing protein [Pyrinomonadaceae bacterium]MBP6211520.1 helix-turn-helix domain-containing protein [Pyrinomonadaceae bacterium]